MEPQNEFDVESNIQPMVATSPSLDTQPTSRKVGLIGVGITFGVNDKGQVLILDTVKGSPAGSCPIVAKGDIIVSIDNLVPDCKNLKSVRDALLGPPGSTVCIGLQKVVPFSEEYQEDMVLVNLERQMITPLYIVLNCRAKSGKVPTARKPKRWCSMLNGVLEIHRRNPVVASGRSRVKFRCVIHDTFITTNPVGHKSADRMVTLLNGKMTLFIVFEDGSQMDRFRRDFTYWKEVSKALDFGAFE